MKNRRLDDEDSRMAAEISYPPSPHLATRFPTHRTVKELPRDVHVLCEVISTTPVHEIESCLVATRIQPEPETVQQVLKLSYNSPAAAAKFFKWAGVYGKHTTYSWNLMVDLLGKNNLFEPMWDAIRSMKQDRLLSLTTFVSIFENYSAARKFDEAFMAFDVMERYGIQPDVIAVNSLLSAICREDNQTEKALEFFERIKNNIPPDADSFAILLEGWEKEGNLAKAKVTFGEMVVRVGWSPQYMLAYDAFLSTLVHGSQVDEAFKFLRLMKGKNCLPGLRFFSNALDSFSKQKDTFHAITLWDMIVDDGLIPNLHLYNGMIDLLTRNNQIDHAYRLLDRMVFHGIFPDSLTYNMIFECLIKNKKSREVGKFFTEMIKNEWPPTTENFTAAIKVLFDGDDPEMATKMWKYMAKNNISPRDDSANAVILGFSNLGRLTELRRFIEKMIEERVIIYESTMTKAKSAFYKEGRGARDMYEQIARKWKSSCGFHNPF